MNTTEDSLYQKYVAQKKKPYRPINEDWEQAKEFGEYVGLTIPFVLRLFKTYGKGKVLGLRSWMKDITSDERGKYGLIHWKLQGGTYAQKDQKNKETQKTKQDETETKSG